MKTVDFKNGSNSKKQMSRGNFPRKKRAYFNITAIMMIVTFAMSSCQSGGNGYVISGKINTKDLEGSKVFLQTENPAVLDSAVIENSSFTFRGQAADNILRAVITIGDEAFMFILVNDKIIIDINNEDWNISSLHYKKHKNVGYINKYFEESQILFVEPYMQLGTLEVEARGLPEEINAIQQRKENMVYSYIDMLIEEYGKPDKREGLSIIVSDLTRLFGIREHPEKIRELYILMSENEKNNFYDQRIQNFFNQNEHIAIGQAVDFNFTDFNGVEGKISDYNGKFIFIDFWATWCGPCLAIYPTMENMFAPYSDKIKIITVSIDDNIEQWKAKIPDLDTSWIHIHYKQDIDLKKYFFISSIPDNLLLSQDGKILLKKTNFNNVVELLK